MTSETDVKTDNPTDEVLLDYWATAGDRDAHEIRSHRAPRPPRTRAARRAPLTLTLAFLAGVLGAVGLLQRDGSPVESAAWVGGGGGGEVIALAEPEPPILDPLTQRVETPRTSRTQRRAIAKPIAPRWVAPLAGKLRVTSCFGPRHDGYHKGLDLNGETGDTVRAVGAGRVVQAGWRFRNAGISVVVRYGDTLVLYAHLSVTSVKVGASVKPGQKVGEMGSTGHSTGSHLHMGVSKTTTMSKFWDRVINPVPWLEARGIAVPGRC